MRRALTAETENQIQATVEFTFRDLGACCWGFPSIVGAGEHTTILHYPAGEAPVPQGALVLLDVGAEVEGYTADITRTFPADGTFSPEQRAIYDAVYRTSRAILPKMRPGVAYSDLHLEATDLLAEELRALGLVSAADRKQAEMYFFHGLGHPLGLQVHDELDNTRKLEPGMVWTLEPGLYVRPADVEGSATFKALPEAEQATIRAALERYAGLGVRIEDDVLITDGAPRLLSADIPAEPGEIEAFMASQAGR
jgi:Xaa-Pro aminopeptidase